VEEVQLDGSLRIGVSRHEDRSPHRAPDGELFHQLSCEAGSSDSPGSHCRQGILSAGQVRPLEPPCQQERSSRSTIAAATLRRRRRTSASQRTLEQRGARGADRRAEVHQGLVEIEDVRSRQHGLRHAPEVLHHRVRLRLPRATNTRNNTRDVGVEDGGAFAKREAPDGADGVASQSLESEQRLSSSLGSRPSCLLTDSRAIVCSRRGRML
jgi:hypothetical protein